MTTWNNLSETKKTELAVQFVIMDAIEKGHTNKSDLIKYMTSSTFSESVENYKSQFQN